MEFTVTETMQNSISSEYSKYILEQKDSVTGNTFMEDVIQKVMKTSAWEKEGYYDTSDIKLAIGKVLMDRLIN